MSIFTYYPKVAYKIDDFNSLRAIDITVASKIKDYTKVYKNISYNPYVIQDGETPDYVAYKLYDNPGYDWVVLLANDIKSVYDDWPKSSVTFNNFIIEKYGSLTASMSTVKYYYDSEGDIIDLTTYTATPSTSRSSESVYEWELRKNTNTSKIKLINKASLGALESSIRNLSTKPIV
jgi:hypothetical protein